MAHILILGGGIGGVAAANVLAKSLSLEHRITLLDRRKNHVFKSSFPLLMIDKRNPENIKKKLAGLYQKGIDFIQAEVKGVYPEEAVVRTERGPFKYDYLIISLGAEQQPAALPGFSEGAFNAFNLEHMDDLRCRLPDFKKGRIVFFISGFPVICPTAPFEMVFLLDEYFRQRGDRDKVEISMVTPESSLQLLIGPGASSELGNMMAEQKINLIAGTEILALDYHAGRLCLDHGLSIEGELFMGVPPCRGPQVLSDSFLVEDGGWITVDPHTLETRARNVYAIGDATGIRLPFMKVLAPKYGVFAQYQAAVVAKNIASLIDGRKPGSRFKGRGRLVIRTGFGRARYYALNYYRKPKPLATLYRPMRSAYWAKAVHERNWFTRWL